MMSLGTLLVKHGWITKQQLGLAISKQREIGGRLGTCLLEMGAIAEDLLNRSLAEQQGVPTASAEDLTEIEEKISRLLPAPIAIRYRAVPFRATHTDVDIAMLEVDNLWLQDELSFIVGRRLNVFIANEARIVEALSRYYKAPCSERFVKLLVMLNREQQHITGNQTHPESRLAYPPEDGEEPEPTIASEIYSTLSPVSEAESEKPVPVASHTPVTPSRSSIPLSKEEMESLGTAPATQDQSAATILPGDFYGRDAGPTERSMSVAEAEVALETASGPLEIGQTLLATVSRQFTRTLLLQVNPSRVRGWLGVGPGLDETRMNSYTVPFDRPSIFLNLREGGTFFIGILPEMTAHIELAECWHKNLADECAVFPIRVQEKLVTLLYGDCGPLGLADLDLDLIRGLCTSASRAFERCILERKRASHPAVSGEQSRRSS